MAKQRNTPAAIKRAELQAKSLELRRSGKGFEDIGAQLGISKSQAHRFVVAGLATARAHITAHADELKTEQLSRLDALLEAVWFKARKGDVAAIDRALKVMERRDKLLGLEAPTRHALQGGGDDAPPIVSEARVMFYIPDNGRG